MSYEDAVEEALCFGWVDGKKKSIDSERYAYRYTPRGPKSSWSELNIKRAKKLIVEGRQVGAGLLAFEGHEKRKAPSLPTRLPRKLQELFEANQVAWNNFEQCSPGYKRLCIGWVASAKQEEMRRE
ncbi:MAG: YdeI/OmpD-associated family protein [Acidobacteria bacterium]|nr:YdeI/OmpD-associated family protein [Acidobacteriota bacterium]